MLTYILPLRSPTPVAALTPYLDWLGTRAQVVVVDGSDATVFDCHHRWWPGVEHVPVDPDLVTPMGKVGGVLTGVRRARHDLMVIADDDVRYTDAGLGEIERALGDDDAVVPQNYFRPRPWHARWDTARTLIARATGGDWPGTLGVRRDALTAVGGYRGDVMFENLELVRTLEAAGRSVRRRPDVYVERRPPPTGHFLHQRVRQAYDELARPGRLAVSLALLPAALVGGARVVVGIAAASVVLAEYGRRRDGGRAVFGPTDSLWAPLWVAERAGTVWLALGQRVAGGIPYGGGRIADAASSSRRLRRRHAVTASRV